MVIWMTKQNESKFLRFQLLKNDFLNIFGEILIFQFVHVSMLLQHPIPQDTRSIFIVPTKNRNTSVNICLSWLSINR